ncbi:Protein SIEVE ELEMENT OCCLUSION B [Vitis vinifera]|uniref:Protein SIEVE ELEMENT OCCLUSION B n=1 Tax=Vitis vinifera TaxID=29760 RepID=A0A438H2V6_VITVI|nr:Protein SIEVE ELEMENT OCCLUSION B [Vitis vinifera]
MMKQIYATHTPDGREVDVKPLFQLVEDILSRASPAVDPLFLTAQTRVETWDDKTQQASFIAMLEALSFTIDRVACEITYKSSSGEDAHATTLSIFNQLSYFPWEAKLIYSSNQLAKSVAILKQVPVILEHSASLKPRFDALNNLIRAMTDVTKCIIEFKGLPSVYISHDAAPLVTAMAHIPTAVYWTIRAVIACASQISSLSSLGHEHALMSSTNETWELSTLAHKIKNILDLLNNQLALCYQYIEEKMNLETYQMLLNLLEGVQIDNMKLLKALIYAKEDLQPFLMALQRDGLDFPRDELSILEQIYNESRVHATRMEYEIVWIPIVDRFAEWTDPLQSQFETLQTTMPWYSVYSPSLIEKPVIRFIREVWHFRNKPILVVLDPQGKVVSPNAIHMMWIWGSTAFPFTSLREEALWREETWKLELLVDGIDPTILSWIKEGKYIYLYGGTDMEWIRKFTTTARAIASTARIPLEMVYVGKSTKESKSGNAQPPLLRKNSATAGKILPWSGSSGPDWKA